MSAKSAAKGWALHKACGSPKFVCAPMVAQSEQAFRFLCRHYTPDILCYSPMFNANSFTNIAKYRMCEFTTSPEDRPLFVQFAGHDPDTMLRAARMVEDKCDAVDLNFGCPQGIARRGNYGSFLLEQADIMVSLVEILDQNLSIPVTCKIRILDDEDRTLAMCHRLQAAGCALLCVHGRTKEQNKQKVGSCDWDIIRRIKNELEIPVYANGGAETFSDVHECLEKTGVDAYMAAESLLGNPAMFMPEDQQPANHLIIADDYLRFEKQYSAAPKQMRAHLFKILHRYLQIFTDIRNALGTKDKEWMRTVPAQIRQRIEEMGSEQFQAEFAKQKRWYHRHRKTDEELKEIELQAVAAKLQQEGEPDEEETQCSVFDL